MSEPFLTLVDYTTQWIFNKSQLYGYSQPVVESRLRETPMDGGDARRVSDSRNHKAAGDYLQLVISASYGLMKLSRQEIVELCLREVREVLPEARYATLLKSTVIKEAAATFSPEPGSDAWRPAQATQVPNLFLAGDWTATGWPATMEGAVRSGYMAAEAVLAAAGTPRRFVQPDLPVEPLPRMIARSRAGRSNGA
jgi:zeta-carotene desaturase